VKASDVDSFSLPLYQPSIEEAKSIIEMEGSFEVVQHYVSGLLQSNGLGVVSGDPEENWKKFGNAGRAVLEPFLVSHFGDAIIDPLFSTIPKSFVKRLRKEDYKWNWMAISLKKK
jgi:SAM dependent carboxyl methyltransferase